MHHIYIWKGENRMMNFHTVAKAKEKTFGKSKKGFTLVELCIVIAVLAIIAAIAIPMVFNVINAANTSADKANALSVEDAIKLAKSELAAGKVNETDPASREKLNKLKSAGNVGDVLALYGIDPQVLTSPKSSNDKFFYASGNGKVTVSTTVRTGEIALSAATGVTVTNGDTLTVD